MEVENTMKHKLKQLMTLIAITSIGHQSTMANSVLEPVSPENIRQGGNDSFIEEDNSTSIGFAQENYSVNEDSLFATITVERTCLDESAMPPASVWYHPSYANSTATFLDDYSGQVSAKKLSWQKGDCSPKSIEILMIDDSEVENDETVIITLSNPSGATLNEQNRAVLTIIDNDQVIISFAQENYRIDENSSSATILVVQKGCSSFIEQVSVSYASITGGTAILDEDYSAVTGILTWGDEIGNNKYCDSRWFQVPILDDTLVEGDKIIHLKLSNPTGNAQLAQSEAILTIIENETPSSLTPVHEDAPGFIGFYQKDYYIDESGSGSRGALIWVERFGCGTKTPPVSVSYTTLEGTATAGEDYQTVTGTFSWEADQCGSKWFEVPITDDKNAENSETVSLQLSEPTGGAKLAQSEALLTIIDNDGSIIGFSQENYLVNEGDQLATITIKRTGCYTKYIGFPMVSVWYLVYEGHYLAASNKDYQPLRGQLSWGVDECTPLTFEVPIMDDAEVESNETITLELKSLSGATKGQTRAILTIIDNEPLPNQIGTPGSRPVLVKMDFNQKNYTLEDTLRLDMTVDGIGDADLYIALISPNGDVMTLGYPNHWSQLNTLQPYLSAVNIVGKQVYPIYNGQLPANLALGQYSVCGVLVQPNAVDILNQENWIYWDCPTLRIHDFSPFRDTLQDGSLGPEMVWVPAGTFRMGDIQGGGGSDEQPVHEVSVERFAIGRYEVTFAEYDKFAEATGRTKPNDRGWGRGHRPVIHVSWYDATAYAKWLSQQTGYQYRLPTEAEWEYAARAGTETKYGWGNEIGSNQSVCRGCGSQWDNKQTAPVGSFDPNPFGLYDVIGNVWEWTCSEYEEKYTGKEQHCVDDASYIAQRSGSWDASLGGVRLSNRIKWGVNKNIRNDGFRLARM